MFLPKNKGNALAQYGIIIGLIALALIPLFFMFGKTITDNFTSFQSYLSESDYNDPNNTDPSSGDNGGSSGTIDENNTSTLSLSNGVTLTVPTDINIFIETAGSSGAVDQFSSILDQLIAQTSTNDSLCNNQDKSICTTDLKRFSDLIKLQADNYKFIEDLAKKGDKEDFQSAANSSFNDLGYSPPAELTSVLPNADYDYYISSLLNERNHIGWSSKLNTPGTNPNSDSCLGSAIIDQYDIIIGSNNYNNDVKDIVKEIVSGMSQLSTNMEALTSAAKSPSNTGSSRSFDPFTGEELEPKTVKITDISGLTNPSEVIEFNLQKLFE